MAKWFRTSSRKLKPGDTADVWHHGTQSFYRAVIQEQISKEVANGPDFQQDHLTTYGRLETRGESFSEHQEIVNLFDQLLKRLRDDQRHRQ